MQKNISKDDWAKYLNSLHAELGKLTSRGWVQIIRMGQPANLPQGEYLNVIFFRVLLMRILLKPYHWFKMVKVGHQSVILSARRS
nr:DUF4019 domain-containing protein [Glaciimonas soli]